MVELESLEATELFLQDGRPPGVWYCNRCRNVASSKALAEYCCNRKCSLCGERLEDRMRTCHSACWNAEQARKEAARREKAEVVSNYDGWVYCEGWGRDGYSPSLDALAEEIEDDCEKPRPSYAWACKEEPFNKLDPEDCFERVCDDSFDGAYDQLSGTEELKQAVDAFNAANAGLVSYAPDFTRVVLLPAIANARPADRG